MRKFTLVNDESNKFWNIELLGSSYTVAWGRIGTKGQSKTKDFASPDAAQKAHDKIIKEKLGEGYVELAETGDAGAASAPVVKPEKTTNRIADAWKRIRAWWEKHASPGHATFSPGATEGDLKKLESILGLNLPEDFKESYRVHNGSAESGILPYGMYLLSLEEVAQQWKVWCEVAGDEEDDEAPEEGAFKDVKWNKKWVPFSHSGSGDHDCVDMDPGKTGKIGQVIDFSHEEGPLGVQALSLSDWLVALADGLENGVYIRDDSDEMIVRADGSGRPQYLSQKPRETVTFLNLPKIEVPSEYADAVAFFREFCLAIRRWKIDFTAKTAESKKIGTPHEEVWNLGLAALKDVYDKYCEYKKELTYCDLSYSHASEPERSYPIVGITGKGKKIAIVIQDENRQYEHTVLKTETGYKVSDKVKIYDPIKNKFMSYYLLGAPS